MARSSAIAGVKFNDGLLVTRGAGILALGFSVLLEAVVVSPFCANPRMMIAPLLLAAVVLIGAGLNAWRHEQTLASVVLVAFGLFSCSQIAQLGHSAVTPASILAQGAFLLFWGIFAALVATQPNEKDKYFSLLLGGVATTLFLKAFILVFAWTTLWALPLVAGVITFALATLTTLRHLPALRS